MSINPDSISVNEKDEVIGRLYSLRAGLSVVAREKETADMIMNNAELAKQQAERIADDRIATAKDIVSEERAKLGDIPKKIDELKPYAKAAGIVPRIIVYTVLAAVGVAGVGMFLFGLAQLILHGIIYHPNEPLPGLWEPLVGWLDFDWFFLAMLCVLPGGGSISLIFLANEYIFKCSLKKRKKTRHEIAELETVGTAKQRQMVDDAEAAVKAAYDRKKVDMSAAYESMAKAQNEATEHAVAGLAMIDALDSAYSDMLDMRDWANTDIIIFALETRRAENMKEALQVVDGERRTERIVAAVDDAGREICKSINTGLHRLQSEMTRCFGILGRIVALQGDRIATGMRGLSADIAANNSYLAGLTTQASMNNALLAKANENCSALADNVTRLRTAAEYSAARDVYRGY